MKRITRTLSAAIPALLAFLLGSWANAQSAVPAPSPIEHPAKVELAGDWQIKVTYRGKSAEFDIDPPGIVTVTDEKYDSLVLFNPSGAPWRRATPLLGLKADECSVENALVPGSVSVSLEPGGEKLVPDTDYILDEPNANIGFKEGGKIGENTPVYISYKYITMRIDSVVYAGRKMILKQGVPHAANPVPPELGDGETRLANIYVSSETKDRLTDENLYPILDDGKLTIPKGGRQKAPSENVGKAAQRPAAENPRVGRQRDRRPLCRRERQVAERLPRPAARAVPQCEHRTGQPGLGRPHHHRLPCRTARVGIQLSGKSP